MPRRPVSEREAEARQRWAKRRSRLGEPEADEAALYDALTTFGVYLLSPDSRDNTAVSAASWGITVADLELVWDELAKRRDLKDPAAALAKALQREASALEIVLDIEAKRARDSAQEPLDTRQRNWMRDDRIPSKREQQLLRKLYAFNRVVHDRHRVQRIDAGDFSKESPEDRDRKFRRVPPEEWLDRVAGELGETAGWVRDAVLEVAEERGLDLAHVEAHMSSDAWDERVKMMQRRRRERRKAGIVEPIDSRVKVKLPGSDHKGKWADGVPVRDDDFFDV